MYYRPNEPTVDELREKFRKTPIVRLGRLALWNALTKTVVSGNNPTLTLLKKTNPRDFEVMTGA